MTDVMVELSKIADEQLKPKPSEYGEEVGVSQNLPFSVAWEDKTYEILREEEEAGPSVRQLVGMRRTDGQARALYRLITLPIRSALRTSTFIPSADGDEGGVKEAEFINNMFTLPPNAGGMEIPFHKVMAQILMAIFDGFAAFEQVYWVPDTGPLKDKITLQKLAHRPSETITFLTDDKGGFAGLRQRASIHGKVIDAKIDKADSFYYSAQEEERPFYGVSYFQSAFYHFDKKVKLYFIAHLAAQRAAVGTRNGSWPVGASEAEKNKFKKSLADLGVAQWIGHPENFKVEILSEGGTFDFLSYINHHNSQMSKSVLANFFDDAQGGGVGDAKLVDFGQQSDSLFMLMLQTIMDEIAGQINHFVIPKFIDWNFGSAKYPTFQWGTFTDEQKQAIRATFDKLATAGQTMTTSPDFIFELEKKMADEMGLEIDYETIEKEREEAKANQKEMEAHQREQMLNPPDAPPGPNDGPPDPLAMPGDPGYRGPGGAPAPGGPPKPAGPPKPGLLNKPPVKLSGTQESNTAQLTMVLPLDELARQILMDAGMSE